MEVWMKHGGGFGHANIGDDPHFPNERGRRVDSGGGWKGWSVEGGIVVLMPQRVSDGNGGDICESRRDEHDFGVGRQHGHQGFLQAYFLYNNCLKF
jgi:hypothetical protein